MKRILSILPFLMAMAFLLVACGPEEDPVVAVTGVSLNQSSIELEVGGTVSLNATVSPSNATDKTVTWSSSNAGVASVSNGVVKALGEGSATITATAGGKSASCQVKVSPVRVAVTGITLDRKEVSLYLSDTTHLVATVSPADATDKSVAWVSSDTAIATVDANGLVTAVSPGTCTITAQSGNYSATCKVTCLKGEGFPAGELPPDNEIWYTTSDDQPLTKAVDQGSCTLQSNTYNKGKGMGILKFSGPVKRIERISSEENECGKVTGILVPDCVEIIANNFLAFTNNVKEFRIPANLKQAGDNSFSGWNKASLERFTGHHVSDDGRLVIIDGVLYGFAPVGLSSYELPAGIVRLMAGVFAHTPDLKSIILPVGLQEIGDLCFQDSGLESVTIPSSVKSIAHYAFKECFKLKNLLGDSHFISADRKFLYDPDWFFAPMILTFFAGRDDTSYTIPDEILNIENYAFEGCSKLKSLTIPDNLTDIGRSAFDGCDNLEALHGTYVTSDQKGIMNKDHKLLYLLPNIDKDYVIPEEVTALGDGLFSDRQNLQSVTMGDQVTEIESYTFSYCRSLKRVTLSANLINLRGYNPFLHCDALEAVYFRSLIPPKYNDRQITDYPRLKMYVPSATYQLYKNNANWNQYWGFMEPYDYTDLPKPDFYISSDYSAEGEVTVYQKASDGQGIDLVIMGDAYSDRTVKSGQYLSDMKACADAFFDVEPYKSFRHLFNIYFVTTVSATEGYERGGQSLGSNLVGGTQVAGNDPKCFELARKALQDDARMQEVLVLICGYQPQDGKRFFGGTAYMYDPDTWSSTKFASGPALVYFTKSDDTFEQTGMVIRHECGHGFGKLLDEYYFDYMGRVPQDEIEKIQTYSTRGWYANVDVTDDPAKVKWANFLSDARYQYDELGVFEGGDTYRYGVWRPSQTSIMDNNVGRFNAPSRYAIWQRIHKLAYGSNWNGTYEDFVTYDAINRKTAPTVHTPARTYKAAQPSQRLSAPVVTGRTWRNALNNSKK